MHRDGGMYGSDSGVYTSRLLVLEIMQWSRVATGMAVSPHTCLVP